MTDAEIAAAGFPWLKYAAVERERRWLCRVVPDATPERRDVIVDLYLHGTRLRLREVTTAGGDVVRKLAKKADLAPDRRLLTNTYLSAAEFALFADLPGDRLRKVRHAYAAHPGLTVDAFQGELSGLILAEAEFPDDEAMAAFPDPPFADREVTDDPRYAGGALARHGFPS